MVDNVVSGERWVASGLTYEYDPLDEEVERLLALVGRSGPKLAARILAATQSRREVMSEVVTTVLENRVIADPSLALAAVADEARLRGFRVIKLGSSLHGDVQELVDQMTTELRSNSLVREQFCVVGVGEETLQIRGSRSRAEDVRSSPGEWPKYWTASIARW